MNHIKHTSPTTPKFGQTVGDNALATVKDVNLVIDNINTKLPYKSYVALLTQSSNSAPVATVLQNELGGDVTWAYVTTGVYTATLTGGFTLSKTATFMGHVVVNTMSGTSPGTEYIIAVNSNTIAVGVFDNTGAASDSLLAGTPVEIRVYN